MTGLNVERDVASTIFMTFYKKKHQKTRERWNLVFLNIIWSSFKNVRLTKYLVISISNCNKNKDYVRTYWILNLCYEYRRRISAGESSTQTSFVYMKKNKVVLHKSRNWVFFIIHKNSVFNIFKGVRTLELIWQNYCKNLESR